MRNPLNIGDYVRPRNALDPIGIIEDINGEVAMVRWGTADKRTFRDDIRLDQLKKVTEKIYSPDEVLKRQAEDAGGKLVEE